MAAPISPIARFATWLRSKRNFYFFSVFAVGVPAWAFEVWLLRDFSTGALWVLFLGALSVAGALLWGFLMWHLFAWQYPSIRQRENDDNAT